MRLGPRLRAHQVPLGSAGGVARPARHAGAAGYLSKYVAEVFRPTRVRERGGCTATRWRRASSRRCVRFTGTSRWEVLDQAVERDGRGPPAVSGPRRCRGLAGSAGGVVRVGLSHLPADEVAAWVAASCAAQGVPVKVTDPTVDPSGGGAAGRRGGRARRAHPRSGSREPGAGAQWRHSTLTRDGSKRLGPRVPGPITAWSITAATMACCRDRFRLAQDGLGPRRGRPGRPGHRCG